MKIAICDDDENSSKSVEKMILRYCEEVHRSDIQIQIFCSPVELLECYPQKLDLLLLDIEMPGMDGIRTAREIRSFDTKVILIFMTNYAKYAIEGYSVQAYNYLLKPATYEILRREMQTVFRLIDQRAAEHLTLHCEEGYLTLAAADIEMVETQGKNVLLHTYSGSHLVYKSMKQMETLLAGTTFRIHTAYLISLHAVKKINRDSIILKSGKELPLSRHRKKEFVDRYMEYIGGLL
jgi:DNA-binding LytR/AlgR family response regulator